MFICRNCSKLFDEPHVYYETHGFTDGLYERQSCCPCCGGDYVDYEETDEEVDTEE